MVNLKFDLVKTRNRYSSPIIVNLDRNYDMSCLVDTGAVIPVWCLGESDLKYHYPDSVKLNAVFLLSGFGRGVEIAPIYLIPNFKLSDGKNEITFKNLPVASVVKDLSFNMILSYTMFDKMNISVDTFSNRNGFHSVVPNFKVAASKSIYHVGRTMMNKDNETAMELFKKLGNKDVIKSIYIFTQDSN